MPSSSHSFPKASLGDLVSIASGKLNSADAVEAGAYPFFTCGKDILRIDRFEHDKEAVLLGGNNANAIFPVFYYNGRFTARQRVYVIWSNSTARLSNLFLYYVVKFLSPTFTPEARGTTTLFITLPMLKGLQIPLPDIKIQQEIANTLKNIDDKIALLRETNATLEAIAQALFKSWFVDFDPVRAKAEGRDPDGVPPEVADLFPSEFEDSELGEIPKGWRVGRLGEISRNVRVGAKPDELTGDTAYIGLEHMPRRSIALDDWESANKVESGKSRFKKGQILFGKLRPYFHKVGIAPLDGVCSTDILVIEPSSPAWHAVCVCHYSSKALVEHATQLSNGAKMPRTNWQDLADYRIVIPPTGLAQAFESIASPLLARISENVHEASVLAESRDTLLPRLMSGKLRIPHEAVAQ